MMRIALIQAGKVINVVEGDSLTAWSEYDVAIASNSANIGDSYINNNIVPAALVVVDMPTNTPSMPSGAIEVSRYQALAALEEFGLLSAIESYMENPDTPVLTRLKWSEADSFRRDNQSLIDIWAALGRGELELDALFARAVAIEI